MQAAQLMMMMMPTTNASGDAVVSGLSAEQPEQGSWFGQLLGDNLTTDLGEAVSKQPVFTAPLAKTGQADPPKSEELNAQLATLMAGNLMPDQLTAYLHQSGVVQTSVALEANISEPEVGAEAVQSVTVDAATQSTTRPEMLEVNKVTEQPQQAQAVTAEAVKPEVSEPVKSEAVETARPEVAEAGKVVVQSIQQPQQMVQPTEVSKPDVLKPQQAQVVTAEAVKPEVAELVKSEAVAVARPVVAEAVKVAVQPMLQPQQAQPVTAEAGQPVTQPQQMTQPTEVSKPDVLAPQQAQVVKPEVSETAKPEAARVVVQPVQQQIEQVSVIKPEVAETTRPVVTEAGQSAAQPQQQAQPTEVAKPDAAAPQQAQAVTAEAVKPELVENAKTETARVLTQPMQQQVEQVPVIKPEVAETTRPVVTEAGQSAVQPQQQAQPTEVARPESATPQQAQAVTAEAVKPEIAELVKPETVAVARPVVAETGKVMIQPTEVSKPDVVVPQQPQPVTAEAVKSEMQQLPAQQTVDVEKTATPSTAIKQAQSAPEQQVVSQQQPAETDKLQANVVSQPVRFAQQSDVVVAAESSNNQQEMKQDQQEQPVLQGKPLAEVAVQEKPVLAEAGQETTGQTRGMEQHIAVNHVDKPVQTQQTQQVAEAPQPHRQEPVARQVAEHLSGYNFKPGTEQVTLKLSPENLGNLQLNISLDDNRLRLDIVADTRVARDALLQQADELRESLSRQNIKVDSFNVTTGNGGSQYQHQQFANWQQAMPQQKQHQPQYAPNRHQNYPEEVAGGGVQYFAPQYQSTINIIS